MTGPSVAKPMKKPTMDLIENRAWRILPEPAD